MITITNYSAHILVDNAGSKKVLIKPFTVKDSYQGTHISLVDTYNVESFINLSTLTGFVYADNADLINQLMLISANTDFVSTVNTYADLPAPSTVNNRFFYVKIASGTRWLPGNYGGLYYPNGTYYSDGTNWITGVDLFQSVQRITGTVTVANPTSNPETGLAKDSTLSGLSTKIPSGLVVTTGRLQVELPSGGTGLTNTEIRATALPVSASSLPLPTGASTETTLAALNTKVPSGLVVTTGRLQVELPAGGGALTNTELRASNLPVSLNESELGLPVGMTSLRDLTTAQRYTTWGDSIADGISIDWAQTVSNGGTNTVVTGEGLLQTSANAIGTAQLISPVINYYPGQVDWVNSAVRLGDLGSTGNTRRWGRFTVSGNIPQDGFAFELIDTVFYATSFKGGVATRIATTSWTKFSTAPYTLDLNYLGAEIRFTSNACQFYVNNILRHTASGGASPITNTLNLPIASQNINTAGATNRILAIRNIGQGRFGDAPLATQPVTYSVVINNLAPALTATDIVTIYGSATKKINIVNVTVSGIQTTASQAIFLLTKRSTANAGGTSSAPTRAVYDSNDPAATATVLAYTANPTTLGTSVGNIRGDRAFLPGAASASDAQGIDWSFTATKNIVLRGATQGLAVNLNGVTLAGGSINVTIEWTES